MTVRDSIVHEREVTPKEMDDIRDGRRRHLVAKGYVDTFMVGDLVHLSDGTKDPAEVLSVLFVDRFHPGVKAGWVVLSLGEAK